MDFKCYIEENPFNNFSDLFPNLAKAPLPASVGGNCLYHAKGLTEMVRADGYLNVRYILSLNGHFATLADKGASTFLFDPFMAHLDPLNLTHRPNHGWSSSSAYPIFEKRKNRVLATILGDEVDQAIVIKKRVLTQNQREIYQDFFFPYQLDVIPPAHDTTAALKGIQDTLYLTCYNDKGAQRSLRYKWKGGTFSIEHLGDPFSQLFSSKERGFKRVLDSIEDRLGVEADVLMDSMVEAGKILNDLRQKLACAV